MLAIDCCHLLSSLLPLLFYSKKRWIFCKWKYPRVITKYKRHNMLDHGYYMESRNASMPLCCACLDSPFCVVTQWQKYALTHPGLCGIAHPMMSVVLHWCTFQHDKSELSSKCSQQLLPRITQHVNASHS